MIAGFGLVLMVLVLLAIRQNLLVVLGIATAYAIVVWGDGRVGNIVVDMWDAAFRCISWPAISCRGAQWPRD